MNKAVKIVIALLVAVVLGVMVYFFVGKARPAQNITWGVDFSQMQAESLGLDWEEAYLAILEDLGVKNIKLHTQWDHIEGQQGDYYFQDTDWQLAQAKSHGASIIYVLGMKTGRWPECHIPSWANNLSEQQQKDELLSYVKQVVLRYKDNSTIKYWQVENEPFFDFGQCPPWYYKSQDFLKEEVSLVKSLDPTRKIVVSDSGEFSMWFGAANIGDVVGITMYRGSWTHISNSFGFYFHYFFSPAFYQKKAMLVSAIFGKPVICIELQAEPWASKPFNNVSLAEQYKSMNLQMMGDNVGFARQTGFDTFYFWGAEWWYWLKVTQNQPDIWDYVKQVFQTSVG